LTLDVALSNLSFVLAMSLLTMNFENNVFADIKHFLILPAIPLDANPELNVPFYKSIDGPGDALNIKWACQKSSIQPFANDNYMAALS
jgi:hypothetical protein